MYSHDELHVNLKTTFVGQLTRTRPHMHCIPSVRLSCPTPNLIAKATESLTYTTLHLTRR